MCRKIAKRIIASRETIDRLEAAQEAAQKCAQLIEEHKKDICARAELNGDLEAINRPNMEDREIKKKLTRMAKWEFFRLPLTLACSPFYDISYFWKQAHSDRKDPNRQEKPHWGRIMPQIIWAVIVVLFVLVILGFVGFAIITHGQGLTCTVRIRYILFCIVILLLLAGFGAIAAWIWETGDVRGKMADPQRVTVHYTSKNDSCKDKDKKVPDGSEYFLIITFANEHEISIDDFTARKTKTFGTATMGRLLAGIFSQTPVEKTDKTKVTYHFLSWKLDDKYQEQVETHFPDADVQDPAGKFFVKTRVFTIQSELLGL